MLLQVCGQPEPSPELLRCQQRCAWDSLLGLHEHHNSRPTQRSAAAANEALQHRLHSRALGVLPILTRSATLALYRLPVALLSVCACPTFPFSPSPRFTGLPISDALTSLWEALNPRWEGGWVCLAMCLGFLLELFGMFV